MIGDRPRRVAVIGTSGSGKTTFSRQVAARLGLVHVELDALFWQPNWREPDRAAFALELATLLDRADGLGRGRQLLDRPAPGL